MIILSGITVCTKTKRMITQYIRKVYSTVLYLSMTHHTQACKVLIVTKVSAVTSSGLHENIMHVYKIQAPVCNPKKNAN